MSDLAIRVENLSKQYKIGQAQQRYDSLSEQLTENFKSLFSRDGRRSVGNETIWALKDVCFEVKVGEVVGIIGRNGAGKSTLLKILSRITEPTYGRAEIFGQVSALLEVGTGFHHELTGRENVYLNGAVLGMKRNEIERKFDKIVAFSEVEKFIDTPIKRYSSGMKMRLAFSVAAHLEPEILIIDEVLAVGDAQFQRKCIGKINDVTREGKTVLLVSHNMSMVNSMCGRCISLDNGRIIFTGPTRDAIDNYFKQLKLSVAGELNQFERRDGNGRARFTRFSPKNRHGQDTDHIYMGDDLCFRMDFSCSDVICSPCFAIILTNHAGQRMIAARSQVSLGRLPTCMRGGSIMCTIPNPLLVAGQYRVTISLYDAETQLIDRLRDAVEITILPLDIYGTGRVPEANDCLISPAQRWEVDYE